MESLWRHFINSKTTCDAYLGHTYQKYLNPFGDPVHLKSDFVKEILVRPISSSAISTSSQPVSLMGRKIPSELI